ncbi:MAG: DUF3788 domain-containing protein [candidate division WOR-3 bacterium]|nr:DUF3788 domain-containing protein [candidate division WOR-3 bacterium]MDH5683672.1 DUF3788 domain-containing protein [candidate division WOR-3 bacterium]
MAMVKYERLLNGDENPTERKIKGTIGKRVLPYWQELGKFLGENYDFNPEMKFYGKKYGWTIQYRKSGKTLCSLFPEKDSFTVLVTLGGKEIEKGEEIINNLSPPVKKIFDTARLLFDGKWLWIRVTKKRYVKDVKKLISIKRNPGKK